MGFLAELIAACGSLFAAFEAFMDLVFEPFGDGVHERCGLDFDLGRMDGSILEETREKELEQIEGDLGDGELGR